MSDAIKHITDDIFLSEDSALVQMHCACNACPTVAALLTSFLLNHAPQQPELNPLTTRFRESYSSI